MVIVRLQNWQPNYYHEKRVDKLKLNKESENTFLKKLPFRNLKGFFFEIMKTK